jgi:hypothetical protein
VFWFRPLWSAALPWVSNMLMVAFKWRGHTG